MARRLLLLLGVFFLFSISAKAQTIGLFGGYTYERLGTSPARNLNGVELAGQYKFASWLSAVADFDGHFGLPSGLDGRTLHFMAGPEISLPGRISPFIHVLGGIGHVYDNGFSSTSFASAFGGGVDWRIAPLLSWRVIQGDDIITHYSGGVQHSARISTGLIIRF
jgi:hypothetical protein